MNLTNNKNFTQITTQELQLKQMLQSEGVSFHFQKVFPLPNCQYIVDFFLPQQVILECSLTNMIKYQVPLRKKAIFLETKCFQLKDHFPILSIWVLFESPRPILEPFSQTLIRLMPSVDQIFFSQKELLEYLRIYFLSPYKRFEVIP